MVDYTSKKCPKCGAEFKCFNKGGRSCWCENYFITPETTKYLKATYDNCLCEECLSNFSEKKRK
ncbi:hypothetical protein EMN47_05070 [Prolixibacteraceae bacterium JC049]|nr:hypothetical protein [Prolixibacteraceae bacterium JC049]